MPTFEYTAKKSPEEYCSGEMDAESADVASIRLKEEGLFPLSIVESESEIEKGLLGLRFTKRATSQDLSMFARQLGNMLNAGLPVLKSLETLREQTENRYLRRAVRKLAEDMRKGGTLADGLERQQGIFSAAFAGSIRAGETGGNLAQVLDTLADHYETEGELRSSVKGAMIYPCFLAVAGAGTVFVLLSFVIPHFQGLFEEFGADLPLPTVILIAASMFMSRLWWTFPIVLLVTIGLGTRYRKTDIGRQFMDRVSLGLPLLGKLIHKTEVARFCRTFGMLLDSGVAAIDAMTIAEATLRNRAIADQISVARDSIRHGHKLADAFSQVKWFPTMLANLVAIAEQTGDLAGVLNKAADIYEKEVQRYTRMLAKMLEPVMIVMIGGVVGFIVIATLLPVFRISAMVH